MHTWSKMVSSLQILEECRAFSAHGATGLCLNWWRIGGSALREFQRQLNKSLDLVGDHHEANLFMYGSHLEALEVKSIQVLLELAANFVHRNSTARQLIR
jgi:hypothetical protein